MELKLKPPITQVVVHPGMARIERSIRLEPPPPETAPAETAPAKTAPSESSTAEHDPAPSPPPRWTSLLLLDLPPLLLESSLQVQLEGAPYEVVALSPTWRVSAEAAEDLSALAQESKALRQAQVLEEAERIQLEQQLAFWQGLSPDTLDTSRLPLPGGDPMPDLLAAEAGWRLTLERIEHHSDRLHEALSQLRLRIKQRKEQLVLLEFRQQRAEQAELEGIPRRALRVSVRARGETWGPSPRLTLSYLTPGATWSPTYEVWATPDGSQAELRLRALIAQATGEDWQGVKLSLSTATAAYVTELPALQSLRIGRAQVSPPRTGFRPPPEGLDALFEGYDRDKPTSQPSPFPTPPKKREKRRRETLEVRLEATSDADEGGGGYDLMSASLPLRSPEPELSAPPPRGGFGGVPGGVPKPPPPSMPLPVSVSMPPPAAAPQAARAMLDVVGGAPPEAKKRAAPPLARARNVMAEKLSKESFAEREYADEEEASSFAPALPTELDVGEAWLAFDALRMAGPTEPRRGRLIQVELERQLREQRVQPAHQRAIKRLLQQAQQAVGALAGLSFPPLVQRVEQLQERFDHRYDAELPLDVPSDGRLHALTLLKGRGVSTLAYRSVPGVEPVVYRELKLTNPFRAPLLTGPCDLYLGLELVATSPLSKLDVGGTLTLGLGVEERIKVARNVHYRETAPGFMSNTQYFEHEVELSLTSQLEREVLVEVLERVPVSQDKEIELKEVLSQPPAVPYTQLERGSPIQGGRLLVFKLPARGTLKGKLVYKIGLNKNLELVGGNRRD